MHPITKHKLFEQGFWNNNFSSQGINKENETPVSYRSLDHLPAIGLWACSIAHAGTGCIVR
jgi:hypothetical protein